MKLSHLAALFAASALLAGCSSLENPFANFFHTGHDARVYNSQTGQFEWPEEKKPQRQQKAREVAVALAATPAPAGHGDGRYFDAQKNEWVDPKPDRVTTSTSRSKAAPAPANVTSSVPSVHPAAVPTPSPPARATGYYNTSTGKIEWQSGASAAATPAPTPAPRKRWWWPF